MNGFARQRMWLIFGIATLLAARIATAADAPTVEELIDARDMAWDSWRALAGSTNGGVIAEAFVRPDVPTAGSACTLVISIRNLNRYPVWFTEPHPYDPLAILMRNDRAKPVALTPFGQEEFFSYRGGSGAASLSRDIKPGCALGEKFPLDKYFDLSIPGTYTALVSPSMSPIAATADVTLRIKSPQTKATAEPPATAPTATPHPKILWPTQSFDAQWRTALAISGRPRGDLALRAVISPVDKLAVNLVVSLTNVCTSGKIESNAMQSYSKSYSPEDGVRITTGEKASDYRILVRDANGGCVMMTAAGERWLASHTISWDRPLRPGEAIGFVFPLDEMFPLTECHDYTALVVLPEKDPDVVPLATAVIRIHVPEAEIPGVTRPPYGSSRMWDRLLPIAGKVEGNLVLVDEVVSNRNAIYLGMKLMNRSGQPIPRELWPVNDVVLIRNSRGEIVPGNRNAGLYSSRWWTSGTQPVPPGEVVNRCGQCIALMFRLRPGETYTLLSAANLTPKVTFPDPNRDAKALVVAQPIVFTVADTDGGEAISVKSPAVMPSASSPTPATFGQRWEELDRFAGKAFGGLGLDASLASGAESGQSLELRMVLRNLDKQTILVKKWRGDSDYEILIRDPAGKQVPLTAKGKTFFESGTLLDRRELRPGKAITASLPIRELFAMEAPGEYTVLASLPVIGDVDAELTAKPLTIRLGNTGGAMKK